MSVGEPHVAVILGSILTLAFVSIGSLDFAGYGSDFGFIVGFSLVNLSLMKLIKAKPGLVHDEDRGVID